MSSAFKFHSQVQNVVPWPAQYQFPTQSNKVRKQTVKLPPKNGYTFSGSNQPIRIEFPADGYCNMLNSILSFNATVTLPAIATTECNYVTLERGGGHNFFSRLRVLYGSLVIEDIQEYKTLVRMINEVAVSKSYGSSSGTLLDGMSAGRINDIALDFDNTDGQNTQTNANPADYLPPGYMNFASIYSNVDTTSLATLGAGLQRIVAQLGTIVETSDAVGMNMMGGRVFGHAAGSPVFVQTGAKTFTKTFALNLLSGLLTSKKLIPLKWMASQLVIELTIADPSVVFMTNIAPTPTFTLTNVNFIAEMLEFDSTYDLAFFQGLSQDAGVPIKFTSWHYHQFSINSGTATYQVHERSRSVKNAFAVIRNSAPTAITDSSIFFHNLNDDISNSTVSRPSLCAVGSYQWRIGGQYYPAQPVSCTYQAAEAYTELMKAIDALGDYTVSSNITNRNFSVTYTTEGNGEGAKFIMAGSFENPTTGGQLEVNGINAEEQSDLALTFSCTNNAGSIGSFANTTTAGKKLEVFVNYDTMLIIRKGNVVDLIL